MQQFLRFYWSYSSYKEISQLKQIHEALIYGFHMTGNTDMHLLVPDILKTEVGAWIRKLILCECAFGYRTMKES